MKIQKEKLLKYLKSGKSITAMDALKKLGIARLAARIYDLKEDGHLITSRLVYVKNSSGEAVRVARYSQKF